jgi:hypothetical protein
MKKSAAPNSTNIEFNNAKNLVYNPCNFNCTDPHPQKESTEYFAATFRINDMNIVYRVAKITPTKIGQFVTVWKRNNNGPIEPFHISDNINLFIISTRSENNFGQFIFPKSVLHDKGILSDKFKEGKRAMRVYPPWDETTSKQAKKTQQWQLDYFLEIHEDQPIDLTRAKMLINNK